MRLGRPSLRRRQGQALASCSRRSNQQSGASDEGCRRGRSHHAGRIPLGRLAAEAAECHGEAICDHAVDQLQLAVATFGRTPGMLDDAHAGHGRAVLRWSILPRPLYERVPERNAEPAEDHGQDELHGRWRFMTRTS